MATVNKDFKVKHGLNVAEGGTFGSTVIVGTPTENTHAATKLYVEHFVTSNISISLPNKSHLSSVGHTQVQYTTNRVSDIHCATRQMV